MMALRPGNSSGLMPPRSSHRKVFDNPSNETAASVSSTKNMPLTGNGSAFTSAAPGKASDSLHDRPLPSQRNGDRSEIRRKNREKGSAFPSHASSPKRSIPANIASQ